MTHAGANRFARRAFTLLEALVAITIVGIISATVLPVINGVTGNVAHAGEVRRATDQAAYAMERAVRLLRDCPPGATPGTLGIAQAFTDRIIFTDNRGLELAGTQLLLFDGSGASDVLAEGVTGFTIGYLAPDGVTSTLGSPTTTHRLEVSMIVRGEELRCAAFPRVRMVPQ